MVGSLSAGALGCDESHGSADNAASPTDPSRAPAFAVGDTGGGGSGGGGGGQVVTYVTNGEQAIGNWYDSQWDSSYTSYSYRYGYVSVSRGGTPSAQTTFLSYYVAHCTYDYLTNIFSCADDAAGYGTIPNSALSGGGSGRQFRLHLSAGQAQGLVIFAGTAAFDLTFTRSGLYSASSTGVSSYHVGTFSYQTDGRSSGAAATVVGNLGGVTVPANAQGSLGTSHQTTIYRYHS
jgi:hypothetical protein